MQYEYIDFCLSGLIRNNISSYYRNRDLFEWSERVHIYVTRQY